jgi:hypothetical protein
MIRISWISKTAILAIAATVITGCNYNRMPPMTTDGFTPATGYAAPSYSPTAPTAPYVPPAPEIAAPPLVSAPTPASGISGLEERKPDLCGAAMIADAVGKPSSVISTLGLTRDYRIVEYRGIEAQVYVPNRVVFRLDEAGIITSIDCG